MSRAGQPRLNPDEETHARKIRAWASLWAEVDHRAQERNESAAAWVRAAIEQRLEREEA